MLNFLRRPSVVAAAGVGVGVGVVLWMKRAPIAKKDAPPKPRSDAVLSAKSFHIVPYSVLGTRLTREHGVVSMASEPDSKTAFVDPAGLPYIQQSGPSQAGAASGAIYVFLGIRDDAAFPPDVQAAVTKTGDAKYHKYVRKNGETAHCIHAVGEDFRFPRFGGMGEHPRTYAINTLATAYLNVLVEFDASGADTLRLLPISSGVFAGPWRGEMADITMEALQQACNSLDPSVERRVATKNLELCIFMESELQSFLDVGFLGRPVEVSPKL